MSRKKKWIQSLHKLAFFENLSQILIKKGKKKINSG